MVNSNLLQLLSKFDATEFRDFGEYIRSPFFNKNESVIGLYEYIKAHHPDFSEINFEKGFVYKKIFPKANYDDAFMRKLMFNLAKLAEDYIAYKSFSANKFGYYGYLLDGLDTKGLNKQYLKKLRLMEQEFEKITVKDEEYYRIRNRIDKFHSYFTLKSSNFVHSKDKPDSILIRETESLINFFLIRILAEYRFLFNYKKMVSFEFESEFYKDIVSYLKKNESLHDIPLLSLYFNSLLLIIEKEESYFIKLKKVLQIEKKSFSYQDLYSSFALLTNFANDEYNKGNQRFLIERHELHKLILENNLFSGAGEGKQFNDVLFKNIVTVGLLVKEVDWTKQFMKKNISKVDADQKANIINYNTARINFAEGNYDSALENLSRISSVHHFHYKPSMKALTFMIYFEMGWIHQAYDVLDTYRKFLSNDKMLPDFQKERNSNFIKFSNELLKIKSKNSKEKINDLKYELESTNNILEKEWIVEKIEEMEKKIGHS